MIKRKLNEKSYACACGGEIQVYISDESRGNSSLHVDKFDKTDKEDNDEDIAFTTECSNPHCVFTIGLVNVNSVPIPFLVSFHPLMEVENKIIVPESKIVN